MCLQKSDGVKVAAPVCELDVFRLRRKEFERTARPVDGKREALLVYLALDERLRPLTLYLGMT